MAHDDSDSEQQRITRRRGACQLCREKKVRCNGRNPCLFCEKHQATCIYPPAVSKPSSQIQSKAQTSQSAIPVTPVSSRHPKTTGPGPAARLSQSSFVDALASEHPRESDDSNQPLWPDTPDFRIFDDSFNFMDFVLPASTNDTQIPLASRPLSPQTPPSSGHTEIDYNTCDLDLLPAQQDDDSLAITATAEEMAEPIPFSFSPIISYTITAPETLERSAGIVSPSKRRKLFSNSQPPKRRDRKLGIIFPTPIFTKISSILAPSSYSPSISALFSSPQEPEDRTDESKNNIVSRVTAKLLSRDYLLGLPRAWANNFADDDNQEACHFLQNFSALPMKELFDICFNEPRGVNCFLNKFDILALLQKHTCSQTETEENQDEIPIIDVFLLGVIATWGATPDMNDQPGQACTMILQLLDLRHAVVREPDSIVKFLGLVAMLQYAAKLGLAQIPAIIAEAISVVQSLKLHLEFGLQSVCPIPASRVYVKRACWVLYCADKAYAMRWRTFPLLPNIEYDLPPLPSVGFHEAYPAHDRVTQDIDWLAIQCRYAKICARISHGLASLPSTTGKEEVYLLNLTEEPQEPHDLLIHSLLTDLHVWYSSVPREGRSLSLAEAAKSPSPQRHTAIITAYQYHEAVLAVLHLLSQRSSSSFSSVSYLPQLVTSPGSTPSSAAAILLGSIKDVLSFSYHVSDILNDRILLHVPTLALCTLAIEHVKGNPVVLSEQRECRALFAMAYGFFGRLSTTLPHDEFFDHVTELFRAVNGF